MKKTYLKYGNGNEINYSYTKETGLLDIMNQKDANGAELLNYDYDFDLTGNLKKLTNGTTLIQNYEYDLTGRIKNADGNYNNGQSTYNEAYTFDDNDRMLTKTKDETTYTFNYVAGTHAIDNITMTGTNTGSAQFTYDNFGNMTGKYNDINGIIDTTVFTYNHADQLTNIAMSNGFLLDFKYDNKGQRIKKTFKDDMANITENVYVSGFYTLKDGIINKHISDGKYIIATLIDNNYDNVLYYTQNNIGSTSMLTNGTGQKAQGYLYSPYGETWVTEDVPGSLTEEITRLFTGQEYDQETGLYYMNARYYDPKTSVFINPDPGMDGLNHYAYGGSNPIKYIDPTGMFLEFIFMAARAIIQLSGAAINQATGNPQGGVSIELGMSIPLGNRANGTNYNIKNVSKTNEDFNNIDKNIGNNNSNFQYNPNQNQHNKTLNQGDVLDVDNDKGEIIINKYKINNNGIEIELGFKNKKYDYLSYQWMQIIRTNNPLGGNTKKYLDPRPADDDLPFYWTKKELLIYTNTNGFDIIFYDMPQRGGNTNVSWNAELSLVGQNTLGRYDIIQSFSYGFTIDNNGVVTINSLTIIKSPSIFLKQFILAP